MLVFSGLTIYGKGTSYKLAPAQGGTKGVLLAPLLAQQVAEHILNAKPLDKEVDISFYDYSALRK